MTTSIQSKIETGKIEAHRVNEHARMGTLPRHFGPRMMLVESSMFSFLRELAPDYQGAYWHYYELSNGGFYAAPDLGPLELSVDGNGFSGRLSADAAGIVACLFCFSHLSLRLNDQVIARHYHRLRDFALSHPEQARIFAAID